MGKVEHLPTNLRLLWDGSVHLQMRFRDDAFLRSCGNAVGRCGGKGLMMTPRNRRTFSEEQIAKLLNGKVPNAARAAGQV